MSHHHVLHAAKQETSCFAIPSLRERTIVQTRLIYQIIVSFLMAPILQETINYWHSCNELQIFAQSSGFMMMYESTFAGYQIDASLEVLRI